MANTVYCIDVLLRIHPQDRLGTRLSGVAIGLCLQIRDLIHVAMLLLTLSVEKIPCPSCYHQSPASIPDTALWSLKLEGQSIAKSDFYSRHCLPLSGSQALAIRHNVMPRPITVPL